MEGSATPLSRERRAVVVAVRDPRIDDALRALDFEVVVVPDFPAARLALDEATDLLVTALRLGAYNGLHLILHAQVQHPRLRSLVIAAADDRVLRAAAWELGAAFILAPSTEEEWGRAIAAALTSSGARDGDRANPLNHRSASERSRGAPSETSDTIAPSALEGPAGSMEEKRERRTLVGVPRVERRRHRR